MEGKTPMFSGDPSDYLSYRKETLLFAEYVGFGDLFTISKKVPVGDTSLTVPLYGLNSKPRLPPGQGGPKPRGEVRARIHEG